MKMFYTLCLSLVLFAPVNAQQTFPSAFKTPGTENGFLKNTGQVRDFENKPVDFVLYQANLGGQQVFITNYGLALLFSRPKKTLKMAGSKRKMPVSQNESFSDSLTVVTYEMERIDIVLKNASILNKNIITKAAKTSPLFNFYIDSNEATNDGISLQKELLVKNVYPDIDWKIYIKEEAGKQAILKYDFIVHPGADISRIQLQYSDNAVLEKSGNEMKARANMGTVKEEKPYSYLLENNTAIDVAYRIKKNTISFHTENYNRESTLVIDPSIFWLTYLSSTSHVVAYKSISGHDIETDAAGNIFVLLSASGGTPFPTINPGGGAYYQDITASPDGAVIISKFAPGGQLLWSTYFGNAVSARVMTIDKFGNIIAIGCELDGTPSIPVYHSTIPLLNNGGFYDAARKKFFIAKFSNNGKLIWSSYYANYSSYPIDMTYDVNGNVYVTGWSEKPDFPVVDPGGGAYTVTNSQYGAAQVIFISQFDAANRLTWSTRIEGNDYDPHARVCTDIAGNIYIGGQTRSTNYPLLDAGGYFDNSRWGSVITRFNPARQMTWSTYFPGPFGLADITTDDSSNLYVACQQRILKFNSKTQLIFDKKVNTNQLYFWNKIEYNRFNDQIQLLGVMNDGVWGFPLLNTACNGSFFDDGITGQQFNSATDPIFATINHDGEFSYRSLADWPYEYYNPSEIAVDVFGNTLYLFGDQQNGYHTPNPDLTNPGNGAYFDNSCCTYSNGNMSALLLKLISSELSATAQTHVPAGCNCDGSADITVTCGVAPYSYLWSTGDVTSSVSGLCPGDYWVRVTDANNLSKKINITIPYPPGSITSFNPVVIPENCDRSNAVIEIKNIQGGTSPYSYSINGSSYTTVPKFTGLDSGRYVIRIKDVNGCTYKDTIDVNRVTGPSTVTYSVQKSSCRADDGQLQVTSVLGGTGPYQYTLNGSVTNSSGIFLNLAAGSYQLLVTDTAGCGILNTVLIGKSSSATDVSYTVGNDHCNKKDGYIQIASVTGGTEPFAFSTDSLSFAGSPVNQLSAGNYSLYIKDANGCILKKEPIVIAQEAGPASVTFTVKDAYCGKPDGDLNINSTTGGTAPYMYSIDSNGYFTTVNYSNIRPGAHTLFVKDVYGCIYKKDFMVDYKAIANIGLLPIDTTVCYDAIVPLILTGDVNGLKNISWSVGAQGLSASVKAVNDQLVSVIITDQNNCRLFDTSVIHVVPCNPPEKCVAIPNAFTPNNDGKNETIGPLVNGCRVQSISFKLYNRWGQLIFETNNFLKKWDGFYKGIPQPQGAYAFYCSYITEDGILRHQEGLITLIR